MYAVILLTVPTQWLSDTCAGGSWSRDEYEATGFDNYPDALAAVDACEIAAPGCDRLARINLGISWDVIALSPEWSRPNR